MSSVRPSNSGCTQIVGKALRQLEISYATFVLSQLSACIPNWMDARQALSIPLIILTVFSYMQKLTQGSVKRFLALSKKQILMACYYHSSSIMYCRILYKIIVSRNSAKFQHKITNNSSSQLSVLLSGCSIHMTCA